MNQYLKKKTGKLKFLVNILVYDSKKLTVTTEYSLNKVLI